MGMRADEPDPVAIQAVVNRIFSVSAPNLVERVTEGVSTFVYRVRRGAETFYLRVLPEQGESFAPEVRAHALLRERGVRVPEVVYFEDCDATLELSVMVTTEIRGCHMGQRPVDRATRTVLFEAGRQLAVLHSVPTAGFGWIKRSHGDALALEAEHPTHRAFATEHLDDDLAALGTVLSQDTIAAIRAIIARCDTWLDGERGWLAHGDFDVTPIFQEDGRYTGIIDFGEIRGADRWYDLGHFRMHDGGTLPVPVFDWLVEGYRSVTPLPPDAEQRICFASLLIAVRAWARWLGKGRSGVRRHQAMVSIPRDIDVLRR